MRDQSAGLGVTHYPNLKINLVRSSFAARSAQDENARISGPSEADGTAYRARLVYACGMTTTHRPAASKSNPAPTPASPAEQSAAAGKPAATSAARKRGREVRRVEIAADHYDRLVALGNTGVCNLSPGEVVGLLCQIDPHAFVARLAERFAEEARRRKHETQ